MTDLSSDIKSLVEKIDSMPAATRDGILNGLLTAKAERQECVVKKLYTPMRAAAADSRNWFCSSRSMRCANDAATLCRRMTACRSVISTRHSRQATLI